MNTYTALIRVQYVAEDDRKADAQAKNYAAALNYQPGTRGSDVVEVGESS